MTANVIINVKLVISSIQLDFKRCFSLIQPIIIPQHKTDYDPIRTVLFS